MISGVRASSMRMLSTSSTIAKLCMASGPAVLADAPAVLDLLLQRRGHVVAQVVEAELGVRAVGDVGRVGDLLVLVLLVVLQDAPGDPERVVDRAHPLGVAAGEVVVDGHDVDALAGERVEDHRERRRERLALAGLHLGDVAAVDRHAADQLHVEVAHAHRALAGLAHDREGLGQQRRRGTPRSGHARAARRSARAARRRTRARAQARRRAILAMRFSYSLKRLDSPRFSAFSRIPIGLSVEAPSPLPQAAGDTSAPSAGAPRLAPLAALVAVALDLARELVGAQVDRVPAVARGVARAQDRALEVQRHLGDVPLGDRRIALLPDLHFEASEVGDLLAHLGEALLNVLAQLIADGAVAALDVDLHRLSSFAGSGCHRAYAATIACQRARSTPACVRRSPRSPSSEPAARSARAQASSVAPVVWTSSTRTARSRRAPAHRHGADCRPPQARGARGPGLRGTAPLAPAAAAAPAARCARRSARAIASAGSNPRARRRPGLPGTGTSTRVGEQLGRRDRPRSGPPSASAAAVMPRSFSACTSARAGAVVGDRRPRALERGGARRAADAAGRRQPAARAALRRQPGQRGPAAAAQPLAAARRRSRQTRQAGGEQQIEHARARRPQLCACDGSAPGCHGCATMARRDRDVDLRPRPHPAARHDHDRLRGALAQRAARGRHARGLGLAAVRLPLRDRQRRRGADLPDRRARRPSSS